MRLSTRTLPEFSTSFLSNPAQLHATWDDLVSVDTNLPYDHYRVIAVSRLEPHQKERNLPGKDVHKALRYGKSKKIANGENP
jgi:hypothetical protein